MAEAVLAAPAAIAALLQLANYGTSVALSLYRIARSAGAAEQELQHLAHRIQLFSDTIRLARDTLKRHCAEYPHSPVVLFIEHHKVLLGVERGSIFIRRRLADSRVRLEAMYSSSALWMGIKWAFKRSSFLELLPELDGFQANLNLLVAVATLEASNILKRTGTITEKERSRLEDECSSLRRSIKTLVKTINRLQMQLDQLSQPGQERHKRPNSAGPRGRGQRPVLLQLGRSMYRRGVVPVLNPRPTTPSLSDRGSEQRTTSRRSSGRVKGNGSSHHAPFHDQNSFADGASSHDDKSAAPSESYSSQKHPSSRSRTIPYNLESPPHGTGTSSTTNPAAKTLQLDREYGTHGISGYVRSSHGTPRSATAVIYGTLDGNVISVNEAVRLGLQVQSLGGTSNGFVNLVFGPSNSERSVGKVTIEWTRDFHPNERYPPLTIECEVSESCQPGLIFGRPFLSAQRRSWPQRTNRNFPGGSSSMHEDAVD